jgi:cytochrome b
MSAPIRQIVALVLLICAMVAAKWYATSNPSGSHIWVAPIIMVVAVALFLVWMVIESRSRRRGRP